MHIGIVAAGAVSGTVDLDGLVQEAVQAEKDRFDHFWFVQNPRLGYDALTMVSLVGLRTSRIELGTAVVPVFTRHPLVMAQQALTVQVATGGRFTLGLGLAHRPTVEDMMGLSYESPAQHMREYLSVLRPLVNEGYVDFAGRVFSVQAELHVPGSSPCPVLIAALAPMMLRIAGELADGTITWMVGRKTIETHIAPRISAAAEAAGRPQPRICVALPVAVTDDPTAARDHAAAIYQVYGQLTNYRRILDIEGVAGPADVVVVGNEVQVERQLRAFADAGATDFLAAIFPADEDTTASVSRTWALLKSLNDD